MRVAAGRGRIVDQWIAAREFAPHRGCAEPKRRAGRRDRLAPEDVDQDVGCDVVAGREHRPEQLLEGGSVAFDDRGWRVVCREVGGVHHNPVPPSEVPALAACG